MGDNPKLESQPMLGSQSTTVREVDKRAFPLDAFTVSDADGTATPVITLNSPWKMTGTINAVYAS